ncbi:hypothetical protein PSECIP111951_00645 [Pseudoalteromonas holothuriae]|uniref:Uncharacterized protein n=1 Tax=Pseudoalteromonas holothuriae TaxID=2963714 RepID=A0ABM9GG81_9GAMM|nr:hypothetical protein [Pseudoalteromonas sp. CIP111951]CAH9052556.1 hypothetical protein PSECIP111951_00645 [Pseudoalteromonas sp. CIP111951]
MNSFFYKKVSALWGSLLVILSANTYALPKIELNMNHNGDEDIRVYWNPVVGATHYKLSSTSYDCYRFLTTTEYERELKLHYLDVAHFKISAMKNVTGTCKGTVIAASDNLSYCDLYPTKHSCPLFKRPKYESKFWNASSRLRVNNCYNYAANVATNDFAQPGYASRSQTFNGNCASVIAGATGDLGIEPTSFFSNRHNLDETLLALVVAPGIDYHWYRRDNSGGWSHKAGRTPARNTDNSNKVILAPESADRGMYTEFCGYFKTKNSNREQNSGTATISGRWGGSFAALDHKSMATNNGSNITLLMYSGRTNPTISLTELRSTRVEDLLSSISAYSAVVLSTSKNKNVDFISSHLGYKGILIEDTQGVFGQAGQTVLIHNGEMRIQAAANKKTGDVVGVSIWNQASTLAQFGIDLQAVERDILSIFKKTERIQIQSFINKHK